MGTSYPWPSTLNFANFVTVKLCLEGDERRSNFKIWRKQMLSLLQSQDVLGFVDGDVTLPPLDTLHQKLWRRTDTLIQGWILGSIGKHALDAVWEKQTARDIWLELHSIFSDRVKQGEEDNEGGDGDYSRYLELYQAAQRGDFHTALNFFPDVNELGTTTITSESETALHISVKAGDKANDLVKKMVEFMPREALAMKQSDGNTALHYAAMVGNTVAAKALVDKSPDLVYILNKQNRLPVVEAALYCQKKTLEYLISYEYDPKAEHNPFQGQLGIHLLNSVIASDFIDIALDLVAKHPNLALLIHDDSGDSALSTLAQMDTLFTRRESLTWWQKLIYHSIPIKEKKTESESDRIISTAFDIENLSYDTAQLRNYSTFRFQIISVLEKVQSKMWNGIENLVPGVKKLKDKKATHGQALQLAKYLCQKIISSKSNGKEGATIFEKSIFTATKHGISEIVEMIMHTYPIATSRKDADTGKSVFLLAVSYKFENIINLFYHRTDHKYMLHDNVDENGNNLLHICAKLSPTDRLNLASGAALQMQRELQWFKEMQKFVSPAQRSRLNKEKQTPQIIFTEEHQKLKAEGEKWMKDTASACSITAALIVTIMFAAIFTIPGGVDSDTGIPIFKKTLALQTFAHTDAISLFSSIFSLLMFLSILSSSCAEQDFLLDLPIRLTLGLLSLIVSLAFMMFTFCVTVHIFFLKKGSWIMKPLAGFAAFPVVSFAYFQLPLFLELFSSTFGPGMFGRNKTHSFIY